MAANSGRNNMLNQITYFAGTRAVKAGIPEDKVREELLLAAAASGLQTRETLTTIDSGLRSGLAAVS